MFRTSLPAISAAAFLVLAPAAVQAQPVDARDIAALKAQVEALTKRVDELEAKKSTVEAPFAVVDESGAALMRVEKVADAARIVVEAGNGLKVRIGAASNLAGMFIESASRDVLSVTAGPTQASLRLAGPENRLVQVGTPVGSNEFGISLSRGESRMIGMFADAEGGSLKTFDAGGQPIAEFSSVPDAPLTLYGVQGNPYFKVGINPETRRAGLIVSDEAGKGRVELGVASEGDGSYMLLFDNGAQRPRVSMLARQSSAQIALNDQQGDEFFFAGMTDGTQGKPRLRVGANDGGHLDAGVTEQGNTELTLSDNAGMERISLLTAGAGTSLLTLNNKDGAPIAYVIEDDAGVADFTLGDGKSGRVRLSARGDTPIAALSDDGTPFFQVTSGGQAPLVVVGAADKTRAELGLQAAGKSAELRLFDAAGAEYLAASSDGGKGRLAVFNAVDVIVGASPDDGTRNGVFVMAGAAEVATLRGDRESGGRIVAANAQGRPTAAVFSGAAGGQIIVAGPAGGRTLGGLVGSATGGALELYNPGGGKFVYAEATTTGLLEVSGPNGHMALSGGQTAPSFKLMDSAGTIMVQAGVTQESNVGTVMVGPSGSGVAGALTGGRPASSILGRKE